MLKLQTPSISTDQTRDLMVRAITMALWFVALILGVQLFWWVITPLSGSSETPALPNYRVSAETGAEINIERLKAQALFGQQAVKAERQQSQKNAPLTNLNVRLVGVSASSVPERSAAIIEQRGQQTVYVVGDNLDGTSVSIEAIYADRVILNNGGQQESLPLEDIGEQRPAFSLQIQGSAEAGDETNQQTAATMDAAAQQVKADPQSMLDYVDISPIISGGSLAGYRLRPGNQPALFNQAGFKSGDIAIAINGLDLTNMQEAMEAGQLLQNAKTLSITILRNDEPMELELEL